MGRNSVTVRDTENFIEIKVVEREILHGKCGLSFALGSRFEVVFGGRSCFTIWAKALCRFSFFFNGGQTV